MINGKSPEYHEYKGTYEIMMKNKTYTILAVDDTLENIDVVKGVLSGDYLVQAAISGSMALQVVERNKPDLILLDIMMPEMDGYEVCRRLKANPKTEDIPIIFLTAKSKESDETEGLALGAVDYIIKPFNFNELISTIQWGMKYHMIH